MSQIKTTEIEGDVAIGRHVTTGGNATIQGNTTVKKNLKVEGWLDARNIKGPNKGIFPDVTKLHETYPRPHNGWWALVGNTLPAPLYIVDGGAWVATGETAGNPTIDSSQYNEAVAELDTRLTRLETEVHANNQSIEQIRTQIDTVSRSVDTLTSDVSGLKTRVTNTETRLSTAEGHIRSINNSKGQPNGIATLDENGLIPANQLPSYVDDVVEFNGFCMLADPPIEASSIMNPGAVLFVVSSGTFVCQPSEINVGSLKFYSSWFGAEPYGTASATGRIPHSGKIYLDVSTNKQYRGSCTTLVSTGSDLALGETEQTAYSGAKGKRLRDDFDHAKANLDGILILPFNGVFAQTGNTNKQLPAYGVWWLPSSDGGSFLFRSSDFGYTSDDYNDNELGRTDRIFRNGNNLYRIVDGELKELGGAADGNCINVTVEFPKKGTADPYYDLQSAIALSLIHI